MDINKLFDNIFKQSSFTIDSFILVIVIALLVGLLLSIMDVTRRNNHSKSYVSTLALLPSIVAIVIMVVGDNIGAGIAVAGAFALVRFRSIPGTAEEIGFIFLAMASGLLIGAGYLGYAVLFVILIGAGSIMMSVISMHFYSTSGEKMLLKITIPEDLDYHSVLEPIIKDYTETSDLISLKSVNMGTMFRITYRVQLRDIDEQKSLIDAIRTRNGNLEVSLLRETYEERKM